MGRFGDPCSFPRDGRYDEPMSSAFSSTRAPDTLRLGVVSFVNTLPLIEGLDQVEGLSLRHSVPSLLIDQLLAGDVDVALCSSIDYQRAPVPLTVLPCGMLGCDGPTLTVRLYADRPLEQLQRVYCDTDSHTSVALMRILLREQYGLEPELIDYNAREHVANNRPLDWPDAMLLIGDKVVTDSPPAIRYPHQLDLGEAWAKLTGLPFVFALWLAREQVDRDRLATMTAVLDRQRRYNALRVDSIIHYRAQPRNWPKDLAGRYLKHSIAYEFTPRHREGLELFYAKARELGVIDDVRPLRVLGEA